MTYSQVLQDVIRVQTLMSRFLCRLLQFELFHKALRNPVDMYKWGNSFFSPLIEFEHSYLDGLENLENIKGMLERGENVFLLANHQVTLWHNVLDSLCQYAFAAGEVTSTPQIGRTPIFHTHLIFGNLFSYRPHFWNP